MVIEHTFVTTLEADQTMQAALQFLSMRGFVRPALTAFPVGKTWDTLEMRRGKTKAARAKNIADLPQVAHVQWDRGRVTVAMSIEPSYTWGGQQAFGFQAGTTAGSPKKMKLHVRMLSAIATGLEQVLAHQADPMIAVQPWVSADEEAAALARRRTRRNWIIFAIVLALFAGVIALIVANS